MIRQETVIIDGNELIRTYSDSGRQLISDETGAVYDEALDPVSMNRTYTEGDYIETNGEVSD